MQEWKGVRGLGRRRTGRRPHISRCVAEQALRRAGCRRGPAGCSGVLGRASPGSMAMVSASLLRQHVIDHRCSLLTSSLAEGVTMNSCDLRGAAVRACDCCSQCDCLSGVSGRWLAVHARYMNTCMFGQRLQHDAVGRWSLESDRASALEAARRARARCCVRRAQVRACSAHTRRAGGRPRAGV
jgi:hypothetical protein